MFKYISKLIKNGWQGFTRQGFLTFATSLVIFIAVVLATSLFFFQGGVSYLTKELKDKIDISVTFKADVERETIMQIKEELLVLPEINRIEYVSPEEAYSNFVEIHENDQYMEALGLLSINPFLPTLRVQTKEPSQYKAIGDFLKKDEYASYINEINDYKRGVMIERLTEISKSVQLIGLFLTVFLSLIAIIITFNTLRLSIYSQKEEIEIMRLVGAKNNFIRGPFLVQGMLCGFFAFVFSFMILVIVLFIFDTQFKNLFMGFDLLSFFKSNVLSVLLVQIFSGIGLGLISSWFAVRKYLRD